MDADHVDRGILRRCRAVGGHLPRRRAVAAALAGAALAVAPLAAAPAAAGTASGTLRWTAEIGRSDVATATSNAPVQLRPDDGTTVTLDVTNTGSAPVEVRAVRLQGQVIGLPFFSYRTRVNLVLQPGESGQRSFQLDLSDLGGQTTGLIPTRLVLLGPDQEVLDTRAFVVDVRGSMWSVYGLFGLMVAVLTALLVVGVAVAVARRRLPENRWQRAMRFLPAGLGLGFTVTFTLSATRVLSPSAELWVPLVLGCGALAFVLGYLSPGTEETTDPDAEAELRRRGQRSAVTGVAAVGVTAATLADGDGLDSLDRGGPDNGGLGNVGPVGVGPGVPSHGLGGDAGAGAGGAGTDAAAARHADVEK